MNNELAEEIRLFAQMIELFHGKYSYQGWVATMKEWARRVNELESPDKVFVVKSRDEDHLSSIHANKASAEAESEKEYGDLAYVEAWMVHREATDT